MTKIFAVFLLKLNPWRPSWQLFLVSSLSHECIYANMKSTSSLVATTFSATLCSFVAFDFKCSSSSPYPICSFSSTNPITWSIHQFCFNPPHAVLTCCSSLNNSTILTLHLPWVTETEFLLTISIQYQSDWWWE